MILKSFLALRRRRASSRTPASGMRRGSRSCQHSIAGRVANAKGSIPPRRGRHHGLRRCSPGRDHGARAVRERRSRIRLPRKVPWNSRSRSGSKIGTYVVLTLIIAADVFLAYRRPHIPSTRESALWITFYVVLALMFAGLMFCARRRGVRGPVHRGLADRVQPVDRQPVRLPDHHGQVLGAPEVPAGDPDGGHHPGARLPRHLHHPGRRSSSRTSAGCSTSSDSSCSTRPGPRRSRATRKRRRWRTS